jgi:hypothetical protein
MLERLVGPGGSGLLSASIVVAAMSAPTIARVAYAILVAVPDSLARRGHRARRHALGGRARRGAAGGLTRPRGCGGARPLSRALGETIAIAMVVGGRPSAAPATLRSERHARQRARRRVPRRLPQLASRDAVGGGARAARARRCDAHRVARARARRHAEALVMRRELLAAREQRQARHVAGGLAFAVLLAPVVGLLVWSFVEALARGGFELRLLARSPARSSSARSRSCSGCPRALRRRARRRAREPACGARRAFARRRALRRTPAALRGARALHRGELHWSHLTPALGARARLARRASDRACDRGAALARARRAARGSARPRAAALARRALRLLAQPASEPRWRGLALGARALGEAAPLLFTAGVVRGLGAGMFGESPSLALGLHVAMSSADPVSRGERGRRPSCCWSSSWRRAARPERGRASSMSAPYERRWWSKACGHGSGCRGGPMPTRPARSPASRCVSPRTRSRRSSARPAAASRRCSAASTACTRSRAARASRAACASTASTSTARRSTRSRFAGASGSSSSGPTPCRCSRYERTCSPASGSLESACLVRTSSSSRCSGASRSGTK